MNDHLRLAPTIPQTYPASDEILTMAAEALESAAEAIRASLDSRCRVARVKKRWRVTARPPKGRDGRNWQLRFFPPPGEGRPGREGKPYQGSAGTADGAEARRVAAARERELNGECLPFAEVARRYLAFRARDGVTRSSTVERYRGALARFEELLGGQEISRQSVLAVQDGMRLDLELAPVTTNLYMSFAGAAWAWGEERELVDRPWPKLRRLKEAETKLRPCTHGENTEILGLALTYSDGLYYPIFCLLADVGSRLSETCALRERDVDRARNQVTFWVTKTKSRTVCVSPEVLALLPVREDPDGWIFVRKFGGPMNRNTVYAAWREITKKLGMRDLPITPHSLRRTWITDSLREGVPLTQSMRHTGHSTMDVHLAYQRNAPDKHMKEVSETVRRCRPPLPHLTPRFCGGGELLSPATKEAQGVSQFGCSAELDTEMSARQGLAPSHTPQGSSLRVTLSRLVLLGSEERAALVALARSRELQSFLIDLAKLSTE